MMKFTSPKAEQILALAKKGTLTFQVGTQLGLEIHLDLVLRLSILYLLLLWVKGVCTLVVKCVYNLDVIEFDVSHYFVLYTLLITIY